MAFRYVDKILHHEPWRVIRGIKTITRTEPFLYTLPDGRRMVSPAVLSETPAQFGAWLVASSSGFTKRSVFLRDEITSYPEIVEPGAVLEVEVEVLERDDEVLWTKGSVKVSGREVMVSRRSAGYLVPLEEYSDPVEEERTFCRLCTVDATKTLVMEPPPNFEPLRPIPRGFGPLNPLSLVDAVLTHDPGRRVEALKNFAMSEEYFRDHFPRRPVVPGVLLSTLLAEVAQFLLPQPQTSSGGLMPVEVSEVSFRRFVEPGDQCVACVEVIGGDVSLPQSRIETKVTLMVGKTRVMQGRMAFRVWGAP